MEPLRKNKKASQLFLELSLRAQGITATRYGEMDSDIDQSLGRKVTLNKANQTSEVIDKLSLKNATLLHYACWVFLYVFRLHV